MYDIQSAYGFSVRVTGALSVLVHDGYALAPRSVRDLRPGDLVVAAMQLPQGKEMAELDLAEELRCSSVWPDLLADVGFHEHRIKISEALALGHSNFRIYGAHSHI